MKWTKEMTRTHRACCLTINCTEKGCKLGLPAGDRVALDGTAHQTAHEIKGRLCDCMVAWEDPTHGKSVAVIELKGGSVRDKAVDQLQAGAAVMEAQLTSTDSFQFAAILVKRRGVHPMTYRVLMRSKITFRAKNYPIQVLSCGGTVGQALPWSRDKAADQNEPKVAAAGSNTRRSRGLSRRT